ncbi:hypothetical protein ACFGVR_19495 [Mucilaginibacter sp. AW1-3]
MLCLDKANAQTAIPCPLNVDFALGDFTNWQCFIGTTTVSGSKNAINVTLSSPTADRHVIIPKGNAVDPYGKFPISPPDGSNYCVKLGNSGVGAQAERVSYSFTIPQNQHDFQITYQYAIVLEDPGHMAESQPRFTAKVLDVDSNKYISCGAFEYVATANLPGFKKGFPYNGLTDVIYKDWTPVTLSLAGYEGRKIKLEFTTADCTASGHFGYAYVDVNTSCSSLVIGTDYCSGSANAVLTGPAGFAHYKWYNADRSAQIDTSRSIVLSPPPPDGTQYILDVVPYAGFGCNNSITATIHEKPAITFNIFDPLGSCSQITLDLTAPAVTLGNDANLTYTYWTDSVATVSLLNPEAVTKGGTYYIKATSPSGCSEIKPVHAIINLVPDFVITNPATTCLATPTDITLPKLIRPITPGLTYTYWKDANATIPLTAANNITTAGTYYVKGASKLGCATIKPMVVSYFPLPVLVTVNPPAVCYPTTVDITQASVTRGSDPNLQLTYWKNATATDTLLTPNAVTKSGIYYIKAINNNGCQYITPVTVVVNPLPNLVTNTPPEVCIPEVVDITKTAVTAGSTDVATLTYWADASATTALANPSAVADSGIYYIKATNTLGCDIVKPVTVVIHKLPVLKITFPPKIYKPGTTDITSDSITRGSSPHLMFAYWKDSSLTVPLTNPKKIDNSGSFFIQATNQYGCYTIKRVDVVVADIPDIKVPTAFTPLQADNKTLSPFFIGVKTFTFFRVYNKWGNIVFQTNGPANDKGWDGMYKSKMGFLETYTWVAEGYDFVGNLVHKTGNTILLK